MCKLGGGVQNGTSSEGYPRLNTVADTSIKIIGRKPSISFKYGYVGLLFLSKGSEDLWTNRRLLPKDAAPDGERG